MNGGENPNFDGSSDSGAQNSEHQKHSVIGSRRYRGPSDEQKYAAATNLANNPNTPEFFSEAVMANTATPQPRKSHKKLIIIGAIIAVLVIVAIVCLILIPRTVNNATGARKSFNQYANYLLYGKEESGDITEEYDYMKNYYFTDVSRDHDAMVTFLQSAKQKLDAFAEEYNKSADPNAEIVKNIASEQESLDFFAAIHLSPLPSTRQTIELYVEKGSSETKDHLATDFDSYANSRFREVNNYYEEYYAKTSEFLDTLDKLSRYGCINREQSKLTTACITSSNDEIKSLMSLYNSYSAYSNDRISNNANAEKNLYLDMWHIKDLLYEQN